MVKKWGKCISVGGDMSRNKCFFSRFEYRMFYVLYPFVTYLLTRPRIKITAFLIVKPCSSERVRRFERTYHLHFYCQSESQIRNQQKQVTSSA
jgi:hypothetical protein